MHSFAQPVEGWASWGMLQKVVAKGMSSGEARRTVASGMWVEPGRGNPHILFGQHDMQESDLWGYGQPFP